MDAHIFDMHRLWEEIRERSRDKDGDSDEEFAKYLDRIYHDPDLEDFDFYKQYVSSFFLNGELYCKEFLNYCFMTHDEALLLLKLVAASFSSTYELLYLKEKDMLDLTIHVTHDGQSISKNLSQLNSIQVYTLFLIYLEEQLRLEYNLVTAVSESEQMMLTGMRRDQLTLFEKEVARCTDELHGSFDGRSSVKRIEEELEALLKS